MGQRKRQLPEPVGEGGLRELQPALEDPGSHFSVVSSDLASIIHWPNLSSSQKEREHSMLFFPEQRGACGEQICRDREEGLQETGLLLILDF